MPTWVPGHHNGQNNNNPRDEARYDAILQENTRANAGHRHRHRRRGRGRHVTFDVVGGGPAPAGAARAERTWIPGNNNAAPGNQNAAGGALAGAERMWAPGNDNTLPRNQNAAPVPAPQHPDVQQALNNPRLGFQAGNDNAPRPPVLQHPELQHPDVQQALNNLGYAEQSMNRLNNLILRTPGGNNNALRPPALANPALQRALDLTRLARVDWPNYPSAPLPTPPPPYQPPGAPFGGSNPPPFAVFPNAAPPMAYLPCQANNNNDGLIFLQNVPVQPGFLNPGMAQAAVAGPRGAADNQLLQQPPNPAAKYQCKEVSDGAFTERTMQEILTQFSPGHWAYSNIGKQYWVQH